MSRYTRNSAILAKIEGTYGTDSVPTGVANAVLVSNLNVNPLNATLLDRDLIRPYFGASENLPGAAFVELSFDVELASSGSMVTPTIPAWGPLLRACGFSETGTAAVRVEYNPVSSGLESVTIYYFDDGVRKIARGCRGNCVIKLNANERPMLSFRFLGLDGGETAQANPALTLTAWKLPAAVTDPNTGDVTLGCTYTAATPALTGGTTYPSSGIEIDLGNALAHTPLLGGEEIDLTDRIVTGRMRLDLTAANEITFMTSVKAATTQALGLLHGSVAGSKILVFAPAMQLTNPRKEDLNGRRMIGFDLRFVPVSGNDELKLVAA